MNFSDVAKIPMREESEMCMVEIIVLKWKKPEIEIKCTQHIINHTQWPYKLVIYDNRLNTPNTARIWNKLISQATCDYVCLINSDAFVPSVNPCWLTRMMETFNKPDCRMVLPVTDHCSTPAQRMPAKPYGSVVLHHGEWSGFCFLFKKSLLDEVGKFDEEFVGYGSDTEFSIRLDRKGGGTYIRRDVFVEHLAGASFKVNAVAANADREYAQKLFMQNTA